MHIKPHTEESKMKMSVSRTGIPNPSRRRETIMEDGEALYKCGKCGEFKPYDEFYKNKRTILGITSECKKCHCKTSQNSRDKENSRRINKEYMRRRRENNGEIVRRYERERSAERPKDEKYRARMLLNIAVRDGKVEKPDFCQSCGAKTKLYAHHEDYSMPLSVEWLCSECHGKRHRGSA